MKDKIGGLLQNPMRLAIFGGGALLLVVIIVVGAVFLLGGDGDVASGEVEFVFDDPVGEPEVSVEEQVRQTVEALAPTPTLEPTPDVPATLRAEAESTREAVRADQMIRNAAPTPDPFASVLSPADLRYLNNMGRPVWLATSTHLQLQTLFDQLPEDVLQASNKTVIDRAVSESRRAVTLVEDGSYSQYDVSAPVRQYGIFLEESLQKVRDAAGEASVMFSEVDFDVESYADLPPARRRIVDERYYAVGELLDEYSRDMQQHGCALCGELYRGR